MKTFLNVFILALAIIAVAMPVTATAQQPDLLVSEVNAYHYEGAKDVWFNLTNYVDVTVKNNGTADAGAFNVRLYADGEFIGEQRITNLSNGSSETLVFEWKPEGEDPLGWTDTAEGAILSHTGTSKTYTLEAVADEVNEVSESNETNNNMTVSKTVKWNGYMADEPLENYAHGKVRGGLIYTTGDGWYHSGEGEEPGTKYGTYYEVNYDLEMPGDTKLARLYFYHTWSKPGYKAPKLGITLKTPSNDVYELNMEKSWLDCSTLGGYGTLAWGTYAYDITGYVKESGTYVVNITNLNPPDTPYVGNDTRFAHHYSFAVPAVLVVYANETMPEREYWINEGADVLMARSSIVLILQDCINNATFEGSIDLSKVKNATLGVVSPWSKPFPPKNVLYFNGIELGRGVYDNGYYPIGNISLDGIRMFSTCPPDWQPQVGVNLSDVTDYLNASVNIAGQGDDGDNMMPSNAFLVITYKEEEKPAVSISTDKTSYTGGEKMQLGLDVKNPLDSAQRVRFAIYLEMPTGGAYTLMDKTVTLPPKLYYSNPDFMVFRLPSIPAGTYTWHAIIEDAVTGEIICEDTAPWEFVLEWASTEDITGALEQTTVVLDFDK